MVTFGTLWLSGCSWLLLHYFFARPADFGPVEHPWAPMILRIHGWIAVASVFLLGWITARHVSDRWSQMIKRVSGVAVASVAIILALTGYALYYTTDRLHDLAGAAHEALGGAAVLLALTHWRRHRPARRSRLIPG
jgi:predicted Na+-dependent transporter